MVTSSPLCTYNITLLYIFGILTYVANFPDNISYLASFILLITIIDKKHYSRSSFEVKSIHFVFIILFIASFLPILLQGEYSFKDLLQNLSYVIVLFILLFSSSLKLSGNERKLGKFVLAFASFNGLLALANCLFGPILLPVIGELPQGRFIFGTTIRSSSGILWNVNYYAAVQACSFWLSLGMLSNKNKFNFKYKLLFLHIALSVIYGSSRAATSAFIVSVIIYFFCIYRSKKLIAFLLALTATITYLAYLNNPEYFSSLFRFERGLNLRDDIWIASTEIIKKYPLFGVGAPSTIETMMLEGGSPTSSTQSTLILTLLRTGIIGTMSLITIIFICILPAVISSEVRKQLAWAIAIIAYWIIDGSTRTYSLGGLGAIPLIVAISLSYILTYGYNITRITNRHNSLSR